MGMQFSENVASKETWQEEQIESVLKDSNADLKDLEDLVLTSTQKGEKLSMHDTDIDKTKSDVEITMDHITNVLKDSIKEKKSFKNLYAENSAGLTFAVQYKLSALGYDLGTVDGLYGGKTKGAVLSFQKHRNKGHPNDRISEDGGAGYETITRLLKESIGTQDYNIPELLKKRDGSAKANKPFVSIPNYNYVPNGGKVDDDGSNDQGFMIDHFPEKNEKTGKIDNLKNEINGLKSNIEKNRDDGDAGNEFDNIGIDRENPTTKDLNKAKMWNKIFENDYDFEGTGDDEDDSRKEFVNFVGNLVGNKNINVNKIEDLKNILDEIDVPLSNLDELIDMKLNTIVGNTDVMNNIGWSDGGDIMKYINENNLKASNKTLREYLINEII